jgi:hypothetical protein
MNTIHHGDYRIICDHCGRKLWRSQCRETWDNYLVCVDRCWYPKHPQLDIKAIPDKQGVPDARPQNLDNFIRSRTAAVTLSQAAIKDATTIYVATTQTFSAGDRIGIALQSYQEGSMSVSSGVTTVRMIWETTVSTSSASTITLSEKLYYHATSGTQVFSYSGSDVTATGSL